jgi:mono/diheme cytochrome c family protein
VRTVALFAALVLLCVPGMASGQSSGTPGGNPAAGRRLFQTKGCVQCHAINGAGGKTGPDLGLRPRPRSLYDVAAAMWNHVPQMADQIWASNRDRPYLTSGELRDLVAFLYAPDALEDPASPGDAARGRRLLADRGCLSCHSIEPPRGAHAGSLTRLKGLESPWAVTAIMWNHAFMMETESRLQRTSLPRLTSDEMRDIAEILQTLMR